MTTSPVEIVPNIDITDDRFTIDQINESHLIIEINQRFIRLAVKNPEHIFMILQEYILHADKKFNLEEFAAQNKWLSVRFWKKITLILHSTKKTFVPGAMDEELAKKAWVCMYGKPAPHTLILQQVFDDYTLVYSGPEILIDFFKKHFNLNDNLEILPIEALISWNTDTIYLVFERKSCHVFYRKSGFNSYFLASENIDDLALKPKKVVLMGEITKYAVEFKKLENTFDEVNLADFLENVRFSQYLDEIPKHRYFLIFNA